jgi:TonB family protein
MFLDIQDDRPDTPRVPPALTRLERVLLSIVAYLLILVTYLLVPEQFWAAPTPKEVPTQEDKVVRFVQIEPRLDRRAVPKELVDKSDLDRRAATRERAPRPENEAPLSRGNTPEKFEGGPKETAKGADEQPAPPANSASPSTMTAKVSPDVPIIDTRPSGGILGNALKNLQRYVQDQNLNNPQGGATEPGADIQFDSKGVDFGSWLRRFRAQVYHNWLIPAVASVIPGQVVISLNIHRDGRITDLQILKSSGNEALDSAAFNALKNSNPTVPLPPAFPDEVAPFIVTFHYILR